jgi:pimeloyl-ACP methyl ester carboxylesterase
MQAIIRGSPIHYEEVGAGRPVVMLHGWPTDHRGMSYPLEPIFGARSGWRRVYVDLPGFGASPGPDWITSQDDMLEATLDFIDAVCGERFIVVGASYGAYLARGVLRRRAERMDGLFVWVPSVLADSTARRLPAPRVIVRDPATIAQVSDDEKVWSQLSVVQSEATLQAFRAGVKPGLPGGDTAFQARVRARYSFSFDPRATEPFEGPALVLCGRQDAVTGYRDAVDLLEELPRATYAVLDRAGHGLAEESPVLFRALVHEWLDRVEEYAGAARSG